MSLVFAPNSKHHQRFSVVVSKKVLKSAVGRNRIRRRVYEAIRLELPTFTAHLDCIFVIYNRNILQLPFNELRRELRVLLDRALTEL